MPELSAAFARRCSYSDTPALTSITTRTIPHASTLVWRQAAENVVQSLSKGNRFLVTGQLKQRTYETADGNKRTVFDLAVSEIGASLKFATATVNKPTRNNGTGGDPWVSRPPAGASASQPEEPPF